MKTFIKKLFTPNGRRNRIEFLKGFVFLYLCLAVIVSIIAVLKDIPQFGVLFFLCIPIFIFTWFNAIQRCHDLVKSGYWMLLHFVPLANIGLYLILFFMPGDKFANEYDFVKDGGMTKDL